MELNLESLFFYKKFLRKVKKKNQTGDQRKKRRKRKHENKQMLKCSLFSRKNNTHKYNSCMISLFIKSHLLLEYVLSFQCFLQLYFLFQQKYLFKVFKKLFLNDFYNDISLPIAILQEELHIILRSPSFKSTFHPVFSFFSFSLTFFLRKLLQVQLVSDSLC